MKKLIAQNRIIQKIVRHKNILLISGGFIAGAIYKSLKFNYDLDHKNGTIVWYRTFDENGKILSGDTNSFYAIALNPKLNKEELLKKGYVTLYFRAQDTKL